MIPSDFQPFSIVENRGFTTFVHALNPMYVLPSRKTLSQTIIPHLYNKERPLWQDRVKKASAVCLTTDCWTSRTTCSYMSVTCHFTENFKMTSCLLDCFECAERHNTENLAEELLRVAQEWQVNDKVVCCVTDDAANITKAIQNLQWTHNPCLAHTINLIVQDALKVVKQTVDKVKAIVEFFHESTIATEKLKSMQRQMGMPELRPKQECATGWNSTFYTLKRILESKDSIISTLAAINAPVETLSQEEWDRVKEVCIILEHFEEVTVEISAESYVTASKMLILCKGLQRVTAHHQRSVTMDKSKGAGHCSFFIHGQKISEDGVQQCAFRNHCSGHQV
ncbi:zinc finger BED domain-containing protein 4-like [Polypterus senegalus]|uniref:zinc finger BED domain-containing protein 4-like n=1 Tax=Polypterus senegalus TaxID=55291 RepID=UPI001963A45A|nr:zinc finger BED domain-containing protein 4-like [Polypterus senegalus]